VDKLSIIAITEVMRLHGSGGITDGMKTARGLMAVGKAVEDEYKAQMCLKNKIQIPSVTKINETGYFTRVGYRNLHARRVAAAKYMEDTEGWTADWTHLVRVKVGSILVDNLMQVATVERIGTDKMTGQEV
jgi:DNA-directed RNA polymerase